MLKQWSFRDHDSYGTFRVPLFYAKQMLMAAGNVHTVSCGASTERGQV